MTDRKFHWEKIYDTKAPDEMSWHQPTPEVSLEFIQSLELPLSAKIIDVGGGDSLLVDHLIDLGYYNLSLLDISQKAIDRAKARLGRNAGQVDWIRTDVVGFQPDEEYDLWHDRATFHFVTEDAEIDRYVAILSTAVKPGGHAIIGTFSENGPEYCSGIRIRQYSEQSLTSLLESNFRKTESVQIDHHTPGGNIQNFLFCVFQRKQSS